MLSKKLVSSLCISALLVCSINITPLKAASDTPEELIKQYVQSINEQDWEEFIELHNDENQEIYRDFIKNENNAKELKGIFNIKKVEISEEQQLPEEELSNVIDFEAYEEEYKDIQGYLVGFDFEVNKEDKYFYNGVNYRIVVTGKENGSYKILEVSDAPIENLKTEEFNQKDIKKALKIVNNRKRGIILNSKGDIIETNKQSKRDRKIEKQNADKAIFQELKISASPNDEWNIPSSIRVYLVNDKRTRTVNFYDYVKNVLPNEWKPSWHKESLKAGAMAVKMYGWYRVLHPKWPDLNADVKDTTADQVYKPGSAKYETTAAINAVGGIGLHNSKGRVFEAQYAAGVKGEAGKKGSGKMRQYGTQYLADKKGYDFLEICHYYYDNSDKSEKEIEAFAY